MHNSISAVVSTLLLLTAVSLPGMVPLSGEAATASVPLEQSQNGEGLTTIIAILRPRGFEPSKVSVPQGKVVLLVLNRTAAADDPDITVDDDRGQAALRAKASRRGSDIWQTFNVSRGRKYRVRLSNHSTAVLDIEVQQ